MNLEGFNDNQIKAVRFMDGPCCVIAGARSGKTRVLIYRIANLIKQGVHPHNILAVTFTRKAADEMRERLSDLIGDIDASSVHLGTFHSICYRILREEWSKAGIERELAPDWWQKKTVKEIMSPPSNKYPYGINLDWMPRQALSFIGYQKNNLIEPHETLIISDDHLFMEDKLRSLYHQYEDSKEFEGKIDFDDMLIQCYKLLSNDDLLLSKYKDLYQYILVDEYQDTNLAQNEILKLLAGERKNIFVVGDDFQSIYGFRASNVDLIINFEKDWSAEVIPLDINYRSTANIVDWSNKLIEHNLNQYPKTCTASQKPFREPSLVMSDNEDEEAEYIANTIESLMLDYKPDDFAILYRTNAQSRAVEEAMIRHRLPYIVLGSMSFYKRREVRDILAYLRLSQNPHDDLSLQRIINTPNRWLGKVYLHGLERWSEQEGLSLFDAIETYPEGRGWRYRGSHNLRDIIFTLHECMDTPPAELIKVIRRLTNYDDHIRMEDSDKNNEGKRIENINSLMSAAGKFKTVDEFLEYTENVSKSSSETKSEKGKVKLMSIHRSKGLEFKVVFVAGMVQGLLPHSYACDEENIEEERRLCYVAMTRAEQLLYLSTVDYYQNQPCMPSQFLHEITEAREYQQYPWQ